MTKKNIIKKTWIILSINDQYFMSWPYFLAHKKFLNFKFYRCCYKKSNIWKKISFYQNKNYNWKLKNRCFKPFFWVQSGSYNVKNFHLYFFIFKIIQLKHIFYALLSIEKRFQLRKTTFMFDSPSKKKIFMSCGKTFDRLIPFLLPNFKLGI